jgi:hypothetical protein
MPRRSKILTRDRLRKEKISNCYRRNKINKNKRREIRDMNKKRVKGKISSDRKQKRNREQKMNREHRRNREQRRNRNHSSKTSLSLSQPPLKNKSPLRFQREVGLSF